MEVEYGFVETQFTNEEGEARGNIMKLLCNIQNVAGDGSCFIYAVLLGMKQLDHRAGMCPSTKDLQVQRDLRERIAQWWIDHPTIVDIDAINGHGDGRNLDDAVNGMLEGPVYAGTNLLQCGGYGGETAFLALANILKVDIVVWNAAAAVVAIPSVLQCGDEERIGRNWSFVQLWQRMTDERHFRWNIPLVHVQFNGIDHYRAWIVTEDHAQDNNYATADLNAFEENGCDGGHGAVKRRRCKAISDENNDSASLALRRGKRQRINQDCRATKLTPESKQASQQKYRATKLTPESKQASQQMYRATKLTPESKQASQQRYRATKQTPESKRALQRLHMSKKSDAELADIRKKRCLRYVSQKQQKKCEHGDEAIRAESGDSRSVEYDAAACEALHPEPSVREAMIAFAEGEFQHSLATCGVCLETRLQPFDSSSKLSEAYEERRKLKILPWKVSEAAVSDLQLDDMSTQICDRCAGFVAKRGSSKHDEGHQAHPFSGWLTVDSKLLNRETGNHNNMHFYPVSSYLAALTEFEIMCLAKYSFTSSVHVVGSTLQQKGCLAQVLSPMTVVKKLPRLPKEIDILIIVYTPRRQNSKLEARLKKQYGVRRLFLEQALQGLLYGIPRGGWEHKPADDKRYVQYLYNNHVDGTVLQGKYFEVSCLPNPAYFDVEVSGEHLMAYEHEVTGALPKGLSIVHSNQGGMFHDTNGEEDVNRSKECAASSEIGKSFDDSLRNGHGTDADEIVTILGDTTDDDSQLALYKTLVGIVGEKAAKEYARSGRCVSVAKLEAPPRSQVLNPWKTEGFWSGVAPRVFSGGGGDVTLSTERGLGGGRTGKRLQTSVWLEHVVWANTNRFAQHPALPILGARLLMQEQARGST